MCRSPAHAPSAGKKRRSFHVKAGRQRVPSSAEHGCPVRFSFALPPFWYGMGNRYTGYKTYTPEELRSWIPILIRDHRLDKFYNCRAWRHLKSYVLKLQHYECQLCGIQGKAVPADVVHHIIPVRDRPDLALTQTNCMALCKECHKKIHESMKDRKRCTSGDIKRQKRQTMRQIAQEKFKDDEKW